MWLIVYSNDHAPLTVRPIYSSSKLRTAQMMIFSLVAMIGLEKCCITSACLQWLCHSGERTVARGPLVTCLDRYFRIRCTVHIMTNMWSVGKYLAGGLSWKCLFSLWKLLTNWNAIFSYILILKTMYWINWSIKCTKKNVWTSNNDPDQNARMHILI